MAISSKHVLVGGFNPSKKYWSIGMMSFPIYGKIKFMFQTTNQLSCFTSRLGPITVQHPFIGNPRCIISKMLVPSWPPLGSHGPHPLGRQPHQSPRVDQGLILGPGPALQAKSEAGDFWSGEELAEHQTQMLHVWNIYHHWPQKSSKSRWI